MTIDEKADYYVDKLDISLADAYQLIEDDKSNKPIPEVKAIEDEIKAQAPKRRYEKSANSPKRTSMSRTKKTDNEKLDIVKRLANALVEMGASAEIENSERAIEFTLNGNSYGLTLVKHKAKK